MRAIPCLVSYKFLPQCSTFENEKPQGAAVTLGIGIVQIQAQSR